MRIRWSEFFVGAPLGSSANAVGSTSIANTVCAIAGRRGSTSGAAVVRRDTARFRRQSIIDRFRAGIRGDTAGRSAADRKILFEIVMPFAGAGVRLRIAVFSENGRAPSSSYPRRNVVVS
jgi:hypothetical protein